jgi:hypothetical protein
MPPKTSRELKEQIESQQDQPAKEGHERTAEGKEVPTPTRGDFLGNLEKASRPEQA